MRLRTVKRWEARCGRQLTSLRNVCLRASRPANSGSSVRKRALLLNAMFDLLPPFLSCSLADP
jgi:hypothetical protein